MTPSRTPRRGQSPQNFTPRAGSRLPGQVRRALDGQILTSQRNGESLGVTDGRLEVRTARGGGLKQTREGLVVDQAQVGEKNRPPMSRIGKLDAGSASAGDVATAMNSLLSELRRTGRLRG